MRRRLVIMRHAKSSWKSDAPTDHERPLNKRGRKDSQAVAKEMVARDWVPQLVVCSDSTRSRQTWERMEKKIKADVTVRYTHDFYHAGLRAVRAEAEGWDPALKSVMVLGHNPGWEDALEDLTSLHIPMKTAYAAMLTGEGDTWTEALAGSWKFEAMIRPKDLS